MGSSTSGIIPRKYKSGSIIYFENDKSEYIYILKSGRVMLTSIKLDTGEEVKEDIKQGEFFGVKSAIGKYPREETAQTIGETVVLMMHLSDFERLVLRNPKVVRKMLRVFSNQLRRIHKMVRNIMGDTDTINPDIELYRIGEYYYKTGNQQHAQHAYKKLLEYYPDSQYADQAMQKVKSIDTGQPIAESAPGPAPAASSDSMDDFDFDDFGDDSAGSADDSSDLLDFDDNMDDSGPGTDLSSEMDSFINSDSTDFDFSFDEPDPGTGLTLIEKVEKADDMMDMGSHREALTIYDEVINQENPQNPDQKRAFERAILNSGICHSQSGNSKNALQSLGKLIKEYPQSEYAKKAYYEIGNIFESAGQKDKAISYYNKVLNMQPRDDINADAMHKIKSLQG